jgi:uncharacterized membrane protein
MGVRRALGLASPGLRWIVAGTAVGYGVLSLLGHWHFGTSYDLAIFDQAVWHYSRFETPVNTISRHPHILAEHFHPILILLAPLYWVAPRPETLLIVQALLLAASVVPVYLFARRRLEERLSLLMTAAYAVSWSVQKTASFDFHELAFAPVLVGLAVWALDATRWRTFWAASVLLLLVKEDLGPLVASFGLFLLLRREWRHGIAMTAVGLGAFATIVGWIMPAMSPAGTYAFGGAFAPLGGLRGIAGKAVTQPWVLLATMVTPASKAQTILLWLGPFAFLPLLSPYGLLLVPIAMTRLLSATELHWAANFHYSAPMAPLLAMSACDGLARLAARVGAHGARGRWIWALAGLVLALCAILPGKLPLWRLFSPRWYAPTASDRTGRVALRLIPPTASVCAQDAIAPHLSRRERIYMLRPEAPDTDYVVAARSLRTWPHADWSAVTLLLEAKLEAGYRVVFERDGWIVLAAPGVG